MTRLEDILQATALALLRVYLLFVPGIVLALLPRKGAILHPVAFGTIGLLLINLWNPMLVFNSMAQGVSAEGFRDLWTLVLAGILRISGAWVTARIIFMILWKSFVKRYSIEELEKKGYTYFWFNQLIPLLVSFVNSAGIPLPLFQGMCSSIRPGDVIQCDADVSAYVFLYSMPWYFLWWGGGYPYVCYVVLKAREEKMLQSRENEDSVETEHVTIEKQKFCCARCCITVGGKFCSVMRALLNPVVIATTLGIIVGLMPKFKTLLYTNPDSVLYQFGATINALAQITIPVTSMVFSATFVHSLQRLYSGWKKQRAKRKEMAELPMHQEARDPMDGGAKAERIENGSANSIQSRRQSNLSSHDSRVALTEGQETPLTQASPRTQEDEKPPPSTEEINSIVSILTRYPFVTAIELLFDQLSHLCPASVPVYSGTRRADMCNRGVHFVFRSFGYIGHNLGCKRLGTLNFAK
eukprot:GHVN01008364.1.p1 GENE.GHVN01008364.1~~GHVN01008364.1.p1  ORF type:complete len:468 (+),score=7.21 GHVN01008364.1:213-1616(+)